jgi:hypothetical protein
MTFIDGVQLTSSSDRWRGAGCVLPWSEQTAVPRPLALAPPPTLGLCTLRWSIGWTVEAAR